MSSIYSFVCREKSILFNVNVKNRENSAYHFVRRPIQQDSRSFECRAEACEFHCRSGRAFGVDAVEKSSEMKERKRKSYYLCQ